MNASSGLPDAHLDLGCGKFPRNPYGRARLAGVDRRALRAADGIEIRAADLAVEPIPWPDASFGSVSAFDFIEHVPRLLPRADGRGTRAPFIELMNEIWRVLAPGGRLWALTPAYPAAAAFQDPTHVNVITERTHEYFCGDEPLGRMYGFAGCFACLRAEWVVAADAERAGGFDRVQRWRRVRRRLKGRLSHLLWEFEARPRQS
ncbi:MAG: methyltransferase domain-containing protein [Betaproteobacteria bacterium]